MKKILSAMKDKITAKSDRSLENGDWLTKLLGLCGDSLPEIREKVDKMMQTNYELLGRDMNLVAPKVCDKLIQKAAMKTCVVGGATAVPVVLPVIGTVGTAIVGASADFVYLLRKQVWLCHEISAVYDMHIHEEELKAVTLAIMGFSGTGQLGKEIAVRTLKNVVDTVAKGFVKRGIAVSATEVAAIITPRLLGRSYRFIPFLSIPLSASINMASTLIVGNHAKRYFGPTDSQIAGAGAVQSLRRSDAGEEITGDLS